MTPEYELQPLVDAETDKPAPPPMYRVLLLNDDFTPMDFVVIILQQFFGLDLDKATEVMLKVHNDGKGLCGVYPYDIAMTKVGQVMAFAATHQHPLKCIMEEHR